MLLRTEDRAPPFLAHYCCLCPPYPPWVGDGTQGSVSETTDLLLSYNPRSCFFETEYSCVVQADLELTMLLPPPCEYWVYRKTPSYTASYCFLIRI